MSNFAKGLLGGIILGAGLGYVVANTLVKPPKGVSGETAGVETRSFACLLGGCGDEPLAVVQGTPVRWRDLPSEVRAALHDRAMASWVDSRDTLNSFAVSVALAKERNDSRPLDKLPSLEKWVAQEPVNDSAISDYFQANRKSFAADVKFENVKEQVRQVVRNSRVEEIKRQKSAELAQAGRFDVLVPPPKHAAIAPPPAEFAALPSPPGAPLFSAETAGAEPNWLVEFTPHACDSCGYSKLQIDEFLRSSKVPVRLVRLSTGSEDVLSVQFAKATFCAQKLGTETASAFDVRAFSAAPAGYDPFVRNEESERIASSHILKIAREAGIKDEKAFGDCLASGEAGEYHTKVLQYAKAAGAADLGTTVILNGQRIPGGASGLVRYAAWMMASPPNAQAKK
jgi:hypothetical protein